MSRALLHHGIAHKGHGLRFVSSRGLRARRRPRVLDESGAVLVLALVFMVVAALLVTGLTAWSGNDIKNIGNFKTTRSAVYAAGGAIQIATWNIRYSYQGTGSGFCPTSDSSTSTDPFTLDNEAIDVWCTITTNEGSSDSRKVTLSAYPVADCSPTGCSGSPYIQSEVIFNDYSSTNVNECSSTTTTTCGSGQTVVSWVVQPGLS